MTALLGLIPLVAGAGLVAADAEWCRLRPLSAADEADLAVLASLKSPLT